MKALTAISVLALLAACAPVKTLEELELAAMQTGDWSAVERRERAIERRKGASGNLCPSGAILLCESGIGQRSCSCISRDSIERIFSRY